MSKISIIEKFAQDAINAPALVTGGKKGCGTKKKSKKSKKSKCKKSGSRKSKSGSRGNGCYVPSPCKY